MKKFIIGAMAVFVIIMFGSCSQKLIIPRAVNTINSVTLGELNLERNNYEILNNITADALISYVDNGIYIEISDMNNEFSLQYTKNKKGEWQCKHSGIVKCGYLDNDPEIKISEMIEPEELVRRMAIYRIINIA